MVPRERRTLEDLLFEAQTGSARSILESGFEPLELPGGSYDDTYIDDDFDDTATEIIEFKIGKDTPDFFEEGGVTFKRIDDNRYQYSTEFPEEPIFGDLIKKKTPFPKRIAPEIPADPIIIRDEPIKRDYTPKFSGEPFRPGINPNLLMAGLKLIRGLEESRAIRHAGNMNLRINKRNVEVLEREAAKRIQYGKKVSLRQLQNIDQIIGRQRSVLAAQGVQLSESASRVLESESRLAGDLNLLDIQEAARHKAMGIKTRAAELNFAGELQYSRSRYKSDTAVINAIQEAAVSYYAGVGGL